MVFFNTVLKLSFYFDQLSNLSRSPKNNAAQTTQHCSAPESKADPQPARASFPNQPTGLPCPFGWTKHLVLASLCFSSHSAPARATLPSCSVRFFCHPESLSLSGSAQPLFPVSSAQPEPLSPSPAAKDPPRQSCLARQAPSSPRAASWNTQPVLPARAPFSSWAASQSRALHSTGLLWETRHKPS